MNLRTAPWLSILATGEGCFLYDPITRGSWDPTEAFAGFLLEILSFCKEWTREEIVNAVLMQLASIDILEARTHVEDLLSAGILLSDMDARSKDFNDTYERWRLKGWGEAFVLHAHTNLLPKLDYESDEGIHRDVNTMRSYIAERTPPSNYKNIPGPLIPLRIDTPVNERPLRNILEDEEISGDQSPLSFSELSWFTYLAHGQIGNCSLPLTGNHIRKTVPSGGSRHPIETYVLVMEAEGIDAGLYHYNVQHNAFTLTRRGSFSDVFLKEIVQQHHRIRFHARAAFIYTAVVERSMFRYRESRSYRVIHHDLGHLMENAALLASAISRSEYRGYQFNDLPVVKLLELDSLREIPMGYLIIG
jgi:SagB-type dehydrogenase family enzyme